MKVFKETSLLDYDMTTKTGGTHCVLAEKNKDK